MAERAKAIYLDHAAATPLEQRAFAAMEPFLDEEFANPSSLYTPARATRQAVEDARRTVADVLGAKPTEIVWTSGGTEGNNLAIQGVLHAHPDAHWVTTAIEHEAVLAQIEPLRRQLHAATVVPVKPNGIVDTSEVVAAITDETVIVSIMLANNEIGTVQPVSDVARAIETIRLDRRERGIELPLYLHSDAVQGANYLSLHIGRLGVDLMTLTGSKIYGPKGIGALYVRTGTTLEPLVYGGGQERSRRSGTENVAGIAGFAAALKLVQLDRTTEGRWLTELRDDLAARLQAAIPDILPNGDDKLRLPNNLNFTIPGAEGEALVLYLDRAGIMASTGSACSTGSLDPSHVLLAIGRTANEAQCSLRLTLGRSTKAAAIDYVATQLPPIVKRVRELSAAA